MTYLAIFLCITGALLTLYGVILALRNDLIFRITIQILSNNSKPLGGVLGDYHKLPSYDHMLWDLTCWTLEDFADKYGIQL